MNFINAKFVRFLAENIKLRDCAGVFLHPQNKGCWWITKSLTYFSLQQG